MNPILQNLRLWWWDGVDAAFRFVAHPPQRLRTGRWDGADAVMRFIAHPVELQNALQSRWRDGAAADRAAVYSRTVLLPNVRSWCRETAIVTRGIAVPWAGRVAAYSRLSLIRGSSWCRERAVAARQAAVAAPEALWPALLWCGERVGGAGRLLGRALDFLLLRHLRRLGQGIADVAWRVTAHPPAVSFPKMLLSLGLIGGITGIGMLSTWLPTLNPATSLTEPDQGLELVDRNGKPLFKFAGPDGGFRASIGLDQMSSQLVNATVATEDADFWTNSGINLKGLARALYENLAFWQYGGFLNGSGGSSITQQLARSLYFSEDVRYERTFSRKMTEMVMALELSRRYTKTEILEAYLNRVFYGNNAYGIEAAARQYFDKSSKDLTLAQAALLAGLPNAPTDYDPLLLPAQRTRWPLEKLSRLSNENLVDIGQATAEGLGAFLTNFPGERLVQFPPEVLAQLPEERLEQLPLEVQAQVPAEAPALAPNATGVPNLAAKERQAYVLDLMVRQEMISAEEATAAKAQPLQLRTERYPVNAPHFVMYVLDALRERYGPQVVRGAWRVVTSLDLGMQQLGEAIVRQQVETTAPTIGGNNASLLALNPKTGEILAMVGSADYFSEGISGQVNMTTADRQPGSSFKPFTYATAFMHGFTPATKLQDAPATFVDAAGLRYSPVSFNGKYLGPVSVRTALANSLNVPAVQTIAHTGVPAVLDTAHRMGISTLNEPWYGLSLTLGAGEVKLLDMTYAYGVFANQGKMAGKQVPPELRVKGRRSLDPVAVLRIEDSHGKIIEQFTPTEQQVLPPEIAFLITDILSDNKARTLVFGNSLRLPGDRPAAVKTGTTDDLRDFWTIGYTPDLAVGVWMGNANNAKLSGGFSGTTTGPIWEGFMTNALGGTPPTPFVRPPGVATAMVCGATGQVATRGCSQSYSEVFAASMLAGGGSAYTSSAPPPPPPAPAPTQNAKKKGR